jgi:hypothetical protein
MGVTGYEGAGEVQAPVPRAAADRAKDPGLINIAYSLLRGVASLAAGVVLGLMNSYRAHVALVGLVTVIARITVTRVRSVS